MSIAELILPLPDFSEFNEENAISITPQSFGSIEQIESSRFEKMLVEENKNLVIIDARYPYEYNRGRIRKAQNCFSEAQMKRIYDKHCHTRNTCIVFYCEFSSERGPSMAEKFRNYDRTKNEWPNITFPEFYILKGGFSNFYQEMPQHCEGEYCQMRDPQYVKDGSLKMYHQITHPKVQRICRCFSAECFYTKHN
jgi:rhodanese-related sulfurtransferase